MGEGALWIDILLNGVDQLDTLSWILLAIFAGLIPVIVIIWSTLTLANTIVFDEDGISRVRFGKIIRRIEWVNVKSVSETVNNFTGWIFISDKQIEYNSSIISVSKMRLDKHVIYFHQSKKAHQVLEKYMSKINQENMTK